MSGSQDEARGGEQVINLYEVRRKIYPRAVHGWFAAWRWALVWLTQLIFYGLPWLTWNGRPAVLFALEARRFYIFGLVLYPQDFIYLTGLLVISALSLFLFTAVAGRLWCGYACPQTVYTEIFLWIERVIEGDRPQRMRLDAQPWSGAKVARKAAKHSAWIALAAWTGFTFVGYFTPIRALGTEILAWTVGPWETFWVLFYGFATWGNAGFMREQVCKYMCPYARFQSAMFDRDTLIVTYDGERGEPRGSRSRKADRTALGLGDCVNCGLCVEVCPTGIDIRNGLQYECIGCTACIDACNQIMDRMSYPRGLIRYDTENGLANRWGRKQLLRRTLRARVLIYTAILLAVTTALFTQIALRVPLSVNVVRDRGGLAREVDNGQIENVYRLQISSSEEVSRRYRITVEGIPGAVIASDPVIEVGATATRLVPVRVRVNADAAAAGSQRISFVVSAIDEPGVMVREKSSFYILR
ncbi:MAG: cytochrome c oxidase accessory protein CcoG [Burkholderiaceae bacterium]|nr:cytochrome c oxidase accessory protein CcoG [Burkholderiaceae bacterium]